MVLSCIGRITADEKDVSLSAVLGFEEESLFWNSQTVCFVFCSVLMSRSWPL